MRWFYKGFLHIAHGLVIFLVILALGLLYRFSLKSVEKELVPSEGVTVKNIVQVAIEGLYNLIKGIIPHIGGMVFQLVAIIVIGTLAGKFFDEKLDTEPAFLIVGLLLGSVLGFYNFFRILIYYQKREQQGKEE